MALGSSALPTRACMSALAIVLALALAGLQLGAAEPCPVGQVYNGTSGKCEVCPSGQVKYPDEVGNTASACRAARDVCDALEVAKSGSCTKCPSKQVPDGDASCKECTPSKEVCNGIDDDCDGQVDEGLGILMCGRGACFKRVLACKGGKPQKCIPGKPTAETCNRVDDDCNGKVDDNVPKVTCGKGICAVEVDGCLNGSAPKCGAVVKPTPQQEMCNGKDDDCDGKVDDGLGYVTCGVGACKVAVDKCVNGLWLQPTCVPAEPTPEVCGDGIDNDCDGKVDEDCAKLPSPGPSPSSASPSSPSPSTPSPSTPSPSPSPSNPSPSTSSKPLPSPSSSPRSSPTPAPSPSPAVNAVPSPSPSPSTSPSPSPMPSAPCCEDCASMESAQKAVCFRDCKKCAAMCLDWEDDFAELFGDQSCTYGIMNCGVIIVDCFKEGCQDLDRQLEKSCFKDAPYQDCVDRAKAFMKTDVGKEGACKYYDTITDDLFGIVDNGQRGTCSLAELQSRIDAYLDRVCKSASEGKPTPFLGLGDR